MFLLYFLIRVLYKIYYMVYIYGVFVWLIKYIFVNKMLMFIFCIMFEFNINLYM